jgi:fatty-acyl-CoA synthase
MPPSSLTLGGLIGELAESYGDSEALVFGTRRLTYGELEFEVRRLAGGLLAVGMEPGDRIAAWLPNSVEWVVAACATSAIGATFVGVNTWYKASEAAYVLKHSGVRLLFMTRAFADQDYEAELQGISNGFQLAKPGGPVVCPELPELKYVVSVDGAATGSTHTYYGLCSLGADLPDSAVKQAAAAVDPDTAAMICYTSGSTSKPKGVILTNRALIANGYNIGERQHLTRLDRVWLGTPLFFSFGFANVLMSVLAHGCTLVLMERYEPNATLRLLVDERCTVFGGPPSVLSNLLDLPELEDAQLCLRTGCTIGTEEQLRMFIDKLRIPELCMAYGMTETYACCAHSDSHDPIELRISSSSPLAGNEIRIVDPESGQQVATGEVGEIRVRGNVTPGYYGDPRLTEKAFDEQGFLRTGDLGLVDAAGHVYWRARSTEMIKTKGINVAPVEVEEIISADPRVKQVHVVGLPDHDGEIVGAFIEPQAGSNLSVEDITAICTGKLARYKWPQYVEFRAGGDFPLTASGKVHKAALRDAYLRSRDIHIEAG